MEPRGERLPLAALERLLLRSYRLITRLGAVHAWREHGETPADAAAPVLSAARQAIVATLAAPAQAPSPSHADAPVAPVADTLPDDAGLAELRLRLAGALDEARALAEEVATLQTWQRGRMLPARAR